MKKKFIPLLLTLVLCAMLIAPTMAAETVTHQFFGSGFMEITNVVSVETGIIASYDNAKSTNNYYGTICTTTTYFTTAPTTITLLRDGGSGYYGCFAKISEEERINQSVQNWDYIPLADGTNPNGGDVFAGSVYVLDAGTYITNTTANSDAIYIVVGGKSSTPLPPSAEAPSVWAVVSVNAAIAAGIVPPALQSKYTQAITRAEFCALAVALYQSATNSDLPITTSFADTTDENVLKMASLGVVNGVGDNKFAPDQKLTREQAATMLARLADALGSPLPEQAASFADNSSVSSWAAGAIGQMQATGIMTGVGNNAFAPHADYTREQSILTMLRLFDLVK